MGRFPLPDHLLSKPKRARGANGDLINLLKALLALIVVGFLLIGGIRFCKKEVEFLPTTTAKLPNFKKIQSVEDRKEAFFDFLTPFINEANETILSERERLADLINRHESIEELSKREVSYVLELAEKYQMETNENVVTFRDIEELLDRVDVIPPSMALAQAALESAWGTSRFAQRGNNLYGMWCYEPGCGIVPKRRPAGESYEVAAYRSPRESFEAYILNLNTNTAYSELRSLRSQRRSEEKPLTGISLAPGLVRYSQEGWGYVDKIQSLIRSNELQSLDTIF